MPSLLSPLFSPFFSDIHQELGEAETVDMEEISGTHVTFFRTNPKDTRLSTILIRGATPNLLDDVERAIDDGVNVYKVFLFFFFVSIRCPFLSLSSLLGFPFFTIYCPFRTWPRTLDLFLALGLLKLKLPETCELKQKRSLGWNSMLS